MATLAEDLTENPEELVREIALAGRAAQQVLAGMSSPDKECALHLAAAALRADAEAILAANARDIAAGEANGLSGAMLDRLRLDEARLEGIASGVDAVEARLVQAQPVQHRTR